MTKIKALIVDDEPRAHKILENYISRTNNLDLAGSCLNATEAVDFLQSMSVDLLFLDITMPEIDGFAFLRSLEESPFVIFTTAHAEFALESYDYNTVDYLKKPIPYERFLKAIDKLMQWKEKVIVGKPPIQDSMEVKIDGFNQKIPLSQIIYIQSFGNYVKIFLDTKMLLTQITTNEVEAILPKIQFLRIHKSYIVNKSKITTLLEEEITLGAIKLPIGKTFKKYVQEFARLI